MQQDIIEYAGSYRYADGDALERALAKARRELDDDDEIESGADRWLRFFIFRGTTLTVNASVPVTGPLRFIAANVLLVLAHGALEGTVEAKNGNRAVDLFCAGETDDD